MKRKRKTINVSFKAPKPPRELTNTCPRSNLANTDTTNNPVKNYQANVLDNLDFIQANKFNFDDIHIF
jgi:hypothetical protein